MPSYKSSFLRNFDYIFFAKDKVEYLLKIDAWIL